MIRVAAIALCFGLLLASRVGAEEAEEWGGLPAGEGREVVYGLCSACHSLKLVIQQGLARESWHKTLQWMVEEQGMPELDADTEEQVLDYLAEHYGPDIHGDKTLSGWGRPSFD